LVLICFAVGAGLAALPNVANASGAGSTQTVTIQPGGISLQVPAKWTVFATTKKGQAAQRKALAKNDAALAKQYTLDAVSTVGWKEVKFFAEDFASYRQGNPRPAQVMVVVTPRDDVTYEPLPPTLQDFEAKIRPGLNRGDTIVSASTVNLGAISAYRVDTHFHFSVPKNAGPPFAGKKVTSRGSVLLFQRGQDVVQVSVTAGDDDASTRLIDLMAGSVRTVSTRD